ncbi:unnamed protein product [Cuscuta campestris]|uniref:Pentacotripeptide-repeat region of PRORP domain-containing protein n=1 Tax=Cuscuta campestris TaxID=132261 RepID=A0A484K2A6_9ASTE|nr:unnamed protein product [Cuscuta campestris]
MRSVLQPLFAVDSRNFKTYISKTLSLLNQFSNGRLAAHGALLHGHLIKTGISSQRHIAVKLLVMYMTLGKSYESNEILKEFDGFNLVVANCLISANVNWGRPDEARRVFEEMPERNEVSWTALVSGLFRHGRVEEALWYFRRNPFRNVVSWTATISGLVQNGLKIDALQLLPMMLQSGVMPNNVTFPSVIRACGELGDFDLGMCLLGLVVKVGFEDNLTVSNAFITFFVRLGENDLAKRTFDKMKKKDVVSWTAILDMYVEQGNLKEARRIFDEMPERNEVSWSAMVSGYNHSGYVEEAANLFHQMFNKYGLKPNISCCSAVLSALGGLKAMQAGRTIHSLVLKLGFENSPFVGSSLVDLYCKCGRTEFGFLCFDSLREKNIVCWNSMVSGFSLNGQLTEARELFDQIPQRNNVTWNSLMTGYLEGEEYDKVFEVFNEMILSGETPNKYTFSTMLSACANLASLQKGKNLHCKLIKLGLQNDIFVDTALLDMYAKSGNIQSSLDIFKTMPSKNVVSWTAMIHGLAETGFAEESLEMFEQMRQTTPFSPNDSILLAVLFACSHCGLVDKGLHHFNSMQKVYGIIPKERHYMCVVDMLSRSGCLIEAEKFISRMPFEPEANTWAALLSGCRTYGDGNMADKISRRIQESGGYVLLSNVYASVGRWIDVLNTRKLMQDNGVLELLNSEMQFVSRTRTNYNFATSVPDSEAIQ